MELTVKIPYIDAIVTHVKKNKKVYILGSGVVIAGISVYIMRSNIAQRAMGEGGPQRGPANTASIFVSGKNHILNNVTLISSFRQGPPSWVVRCLESDEIFTSQRAAALAKNINESDLSQHLNGLHRHVNGLHFERICLAA